MTAKRKTRPPVAPPRPRHLFCVPVVHELPRRRVEEDATW
jgi:hypothetical protein